MEDINNALLHIKSKHNGEIPYKYGSNECAKLMDSYAKEYHERKLKLLGIADVVGQSEQLFCYHNGTYTTFKDENNIEVCCKCKREVAK